MKKIRKSLVSHARVMTSAYCARHSYQTRTRDLLEFEYVVTHVPERTLTTMLLL
jgi:hypothetical protein